LAFYGLKLELWMGYFSVILYAVTAVYFAGVMVRLMLTLTPVVCVLAGIAFSYTYEVNRHHLLYCQREQYFLFWAHILTLFNDNIKLCEAGLE
jgi:hypothetical protein